ncbi:DUF1304 domain-containing protein [Flavobacterium oreochromis]|uniref:DUF1304 domain-containing protein n=1 Tax=Flavobacterium columnare TaxID=996 RepID=A0A246GA22_9FLAO|nr:DUF1304 domain-containing protein [Flavobacterium oreochromis]OWP74823.1 hypothetical protein BWK62_13340 [Flavobacterium oreochromis]OWP77742.1 hypothetical protein BWG23_04075 [Flavobacterium oreochromis]POR25111.1 hypothetical protein BWK58_07250 [Flavobacterium columnare]
MMILTKIIIGFVAFVHVHIMGLEIFVWTTKAPKVFKSISKDLFKSTKTLAANQGLYNGFIAAGLIGSLLLNNTEWFQNISLFFLSCVAIARIYGALTISKRILYVQTIPSLLGIVTVLFN